MVEEQKMEQRGQAVKRLRSLFDMHHIAFGAPENLGVLLLNLHENRHFAMDFWSVVNALSEGGSGSLSDEEVLEAVVEGSAGVLPGAIPEYERPGVHELRQMLAGVDTARPVELPAPIASPVDSLLPQRTVTAKFSAEVASLGNEDALKTRRSIGEALAKLEQSTRELREQLSQIDAQMSGAQTHPPKSAQAPLDAVRVEAVEPDEEQAETLSKWNRIAASPKSVEDLRQPQPVREQTASPPAGAIPSQAPRPIPSELPSRQPSFVAPVVPAAAATPPAPAAVDPVVFAPRPAHTQRGLALPDPDDDPSIKAPFSNYAAEHERSSAGRFAIAALVVAALAAGGYFVARTGPGHAMLQEAGSTIHDKYNSLMGHTGVAATAPQKPAEEPAVAARDEAATIPSPTPTAATAPPGAAETASTPPAQPAAVPTAAQATDAVKRRAESAAGATNSSTPERIVDSSVLHVPSSTMAANLIFSRVPAYPEPAREQGIEGQVVMDVVISQSGTVKYVRVIDGDRHLRLAAEDAVMRWRYKPYVLNGSPVEVATTVRVDFRLPR